MREDLPSIENVTVKAISLFDENKYNAEGDSNIELTIKVKTVN